MVGSWVGRQAEDHGRCNDSAGTCQTCQLMGTMVQPMVEESRTPESHLEVGREGLMPERASCTQEMTDTARFQPEPLQGGASKNNS